jgi:excisionase family DNA binding protein
MTTSEHPSPISNDPAAILARITADLAQLGQSLAARPASIPIEAARPRLLHTVEEAADRLSLSRSALYELTRSGEIASVKVGGRRRIPQGALDAYVAGLIPAEPPAAAS